MTKPIRVAAILAAALLASGCQSNAQTPTMQPGEAPPGMVWVPGGEFAMGGDDQFATAAEQPVHGVRVDGFFMDTYTVTNARFREFVEATGYLTVAERVPEVADLMRQVPPGTPPPDPKLLVPGSIVFAPTTQPVDLRDWSQWWKWTPGADWRHPDGPTSSIVGKDDYPVVQVAWDDARAYATWASRRLPTEAEWEFAARGGANRRHHTWGDAAFDPRRPQAHIYEGTFPTRAAAPKAVGQYPATGFGLFDMAGNVWQWTLDWYRADSYRGDAEHGLVSNPTGPSTGLDPATEGQPTRVVRGGSYLCNDSYCRGYRVSARNPGAPDTGTPHIGFRTVMTVDQWRQWKTTTGAARPPNVVVILVDDLRWDDLGIEGHPFVETSTIDRLAREGVRFRNAFATTPLCSPSRAAILTGQYVHTNGIVDNTARDSASHRLATFARPLAKAGYQTGFFGKWHMGNDDSPRPGFTHWVAMKGQGEAINPKFNIDGTRTEEKGYVTDLLTDHVVRFMQRSRGKPFLVFLAHKALHPNIVQRDDGSTGAVAGQPEGFIPAERHRGRYATAMVPRRPNAGPPVVGKPALLRPLDGVPPLGPTTGTPDKDIRDRLEMLLAVDESLARLIETLKAMGEYQRTAIILTSDHGYFYGEHHLNDERRLAYEETARIPLIVRYPPVAVAGATPTQMVQTIDLAPTILELARVADTVTRHGKSLVPLLRGANVPWRHSVLIEYYSDTVFPRIRNMGYQAVRTERYKYIHYLELPGMDELYDLQVDPFEMDNIIGSAKGRAVLPSVEAELARLLRETS